jgi:hypothetical protein
MKERKRNMEKTGRATQVGKRRLASRRRNTVRENRFAGKNPISLTLALIQTLFLVLGLMIALEKPAFAAWDVKQTVWTDADESEYGAFVQSMGQSPAQSFQEFVRDEKSNPLFDPRDANLRVSPDCAELPYFARAYVAYKRGLPFSFMSQIVGKGGNPKYSDGNQPGGTNSQDEFSSPQELFDALKKIHSGFYRMKADTEGNDTFPTTIDRESIRPGTLYYDPQGHIAMVTEVGKDGRIRMVDSHPDYSLTRPWFGTKFAAGSENNGGGFRRWRPLTQNGDAKPVRVKNAHIGDYSGKEQFQGSFAANGKEGLGYHEYVKEKLKNDRSPQDPRSVFQKDLREVVDEIKDRQVAVEKAVVSGIPRKSHPGKLPRNIYGATGEWEVYSSPSRDARLKKAFQDLLERTEKLVGSVERADPAYSYAGDGAKLADELLKSLEQNASNPILQYANSKGQPVPLTFREVTKRLADLSFDPYHSPELRWGARGEERHFANDDEKKMEMYEKERRLRNQIERVYDRPTGFDFGPEEAVEFDVEALLALLRKAFLEQKGINEEAKDKEGTEEMSALKKFMGALAAWVALFGGWGMLLAWLKRENKDEPEPGTIPSIFRTGEKERSKTEMVLDGSFKANEVGSEAGLPQRPKKPAQVEFLKLKSMEVEEALPLDFDTIPGKPLAQAKTDSPAVPTPSGLWKTLKKGRPTIDRAMAAGV